MISESFLDRVESNLQYLCQWDNVDRRGEDVEVEKGDCDSVAGRPLDQGPAQVEADHPTKGSFVGLVHQVPR